MNTLYRNQFKLEVYINFDSESKPKLIYGGKVVTTNKKFIGVNITDLRKYYPLHDDVHKAVDSIVREAFKFMVSKERADRNMPHMLSKPVVITQNGKLRGGDVYAYFYPELITEFTLDDGIHNNETWEYETWGNFLKEIGATLDDEGISEKVLCNDIFPVHI